MRLQAKDARRGDLGNRSLVNMFAVAVTVRRHGDGPNVPEALHRALARAGYMLVSDDA